MSTPEIWIPDDWDGSTYECHLIDWPSSEQWRAILRGFVSTPARGRFWAAQSGNIKAAQAVGNEIIARNPIDMSCQEITTQLQAIVAALAAIDVNIVNQVNATANQTNSIDVQTTAIANANATASAVAAAYANVTVKQQVYVDLRPLGGPLDPPQPQEAAEAGISTTTIDSNTKCATSYWLTRAALEFFTWLRDNYIPFWFETSTAALAAIGTALKVAAWRLSGPGTPVLLGASALTAMVEYIVYLEKNALADPVLNQLVSWLSADFDDIRCHMYNFIGGSDTEQVQGEIVDMAITFGVQVAATVLIQQFFNLNNLALMIYDSPFIDVPALPPGVDCLDCAGV